MNKYALNKTLGAKTSILTNILEANLNLILMPKKIACNSQKDRVWGGLFESQ